MNTEPKATIDYETRSQCDIKKHGSYLYSMHPSTSVLCLGFHLPDGREGLWHPAFPEAGIEAVPMSVLQPLFDWIALGGAVEAHNSLFEWGIWLNVCVARMGWPTVADDQWRDSAAKAAANGLPRSLEGLGAALGLHSQKNMPGHRAMLRCSKPRRPTPGEKAAMAAGLLDAKAMLWHNDRDDLLTTFSYCMDDVHSEHEASEVIPDLSPYELRVWQADQKMNRRGVMIDRALARSAIWLATQAKERMNQELARLTKGVVRKATQRTAVKLWLRDEMLLDLQDTKGDTVDRLLASPAGKGLHPDCIDILNIVRNANRTSVSKYQRMIDMSDPVDWRARGLVAYCGAERTGRWAGRGIQVHNLTTGRDLNPDTGDYPWNTTMDQACADVMLGLDWCEVIYGDVMKLLSLISRGALIAPEGKEFLVADYAAVEARVVLWLARAMKALDVFRRGEDIYCDMASGIYGRPITKKDKTERQFGKQAILGLGFGMGFIKFLITCRGYKISFTREDALRIMGPARLAKYEAWVKKRLLLGYTETELRNMTKTKEGKAQRVAALTDRRKLVEGRANPSMNGVWVPGIDPHHDELMEIVHELAIMKFTVDVYRTRYPEVPKMWKEQEDAAVRAIQNPGHRIVAGRVTWYVEGRYLRCELPSGGGPGARSLAYVDPFLKSTKTPWGETRPSIRFFGNHQITKFWARLATYGGKLVENMTQATARNLLAHAFMVMSEMDSGYVPVIHTHDEIVSEVDESEGSREEYNDLMVTMTDDFEGCPIAADVMPRLKRYRK